MSKLSVNAVLPANGLNIGIGTAGGNLIVGGASTTVVVNGDINITGNVTGSSGLSVQTSASRQLNVETDSGDGNLVLKCTAPNSSNNLRDIDIAGENVSLSTGAFDTTAHAERLVIDSTGRIGVGTNTFNDDAEVMRVQAAEGQNNTLFTI